MSILKVGLTPLQASEFDHCAQDFFYFLKTYIKAESGEKFPIQDYHQDWAKLVADQRRVLAVKFLHCGFSSLAMAYNLWQGLFHDHCRTRWIAKNEPDKQAARSLLEKLSSRLPDWMQPHGTHEHYPVDLVRFRNGSQLEFDDGSIIGKPINLKYSLLILNDAAFYHLDELVWKDGLGRLVPNGKVICQSFPNGDKGAFAKARQDSDWSIFNCSYTRHNFYDNKEEVVALRSKHDRVWFAEQVEGKFLSESEKQKLRDQEVDNTMADVDQFISQTSPKFSNNYFSNCKTREQIDNYEYEGFRLRSVEAEPFKDCFADQYGSVAFDTPSTPEQKQRVEQITAIPDIRKCKIEWNEDDAKVYDEVTERIAELKSMCRPEFVDTAFNSENTEMEEMKELIEVANNEEKPVKAKVKARKTLRAQCEDLVSRIEELPPIRQSKQNSVPSLSCDLLKLAGVVSTDRECDDEEDIDYRAILVSKIAEKGLPDEIELDLDDEFLTVNGTKTKISTESIEMAFAGLAVLSTPQEALEKVGRLVRKKLAYVF